MTAALGFIILAVAIVASATVAVCLGHITSDQWLSVTGASGVLGSAGHYLSAGTKP